LRTNSTAIAAIAVHRGDADSLICGAFGQYLGHLNDVRQILARSGHYPQGALSLMILEDGPLFVADTQVNPIPSPEQIANSAIGAVRHARRFGIEPKVALCSHSNFGNLDSDSGRRMRAALEIMDARECDFVYEGEMSLDAAMDEDLRERIFPNSRLKGPANILIFAYTDTANAARNMLKMKGGGLEVGPILMGMANRAHIVTPSITVRGLLNVSALAGGPVALYG
jgi:malate dehydrogenase (oxaloacetate-decarboxylating)(NADP+)